MVSLNQVGVYFGAFCLFSDMSFMINQRDRIGLVGKNGAGKSTLLKLIIGEMGYEEGTISKPTDLTLGYLPQQMNVSNKLSVFNETMKAFEELMELERKINFINEELKTRDDFHSEGYNKLIHDLSHLNDRYHILEGTSMEANIEQILIGLGFERKDFDRPTKELSGGWRMRIELAKILLKQPDLLLLDEPTNHLDIESIQWLEDFLKDYPGAVLLISHDRAFLDAVTNRTIELVMGKMHDYKVSYSKFEQLRKERREQQLNAFKNQQKKIEETEDFIERFRYKATKAVQVQSRIKQLDKIERIEVDEVENARLRFRFPPAPHSGNDVVLIKELTKKYGDLMVLNNIDYYLEKGEKVAFVGRNGEGKSTLSKIIVGELDYTGEFKLGHNVKIGYYAQNQDELLDENKTVFQIIDDAAVGEMRTKTRDLLGSFLFSGETIDKKVKVLSGGERSRLAMAKMLLEPVNLLVLDEPTNHLDMMSKDILKQALGQYDGTLIIVSHDRHFLDGLVDKIYEFRNNKIKEHLGSIYEFLRKRKLANLVEIERKDKQSKAKKETSDQKQIYEQRKEFDRDMRKVENQVKKEEDKIHKLETEIARMDALLAKPENISDENLFSEYGKIKKQLEHAMESWAEAQEKLEAMETERERIFS
ncbi:MAG: ATP-binding cassette domain-containing protein [Bacteroidales bacterium]|nr:ATP-binding cassette domain-containing protein [Bacteroidales bacterium]MCF8457801.1 ATP-binding cassette domain-containing protein [Bacteroidales bacterium]